MKTHKKTNRSSMKLSRTLTLAAACVLGVSVSASAQLIDVINRSLERPVEELFMGQTVYSQDQGAVQTTVGMNHHRDGDLRNSNMSIRAEYGITDRLQAQANLPIDIADRSENFDAQAGVSRASVGALYNLIDGRAPIAFSVGGDIEFPLGSTNSVTGDRPMAGPIYKPSLIAARNFGPAELHASTQAEFGADNRALNYSIGSMYDLGRFTPTLEMSARAVENTRPEVYATPGLYYNFSERAELGIGAAIGLNDQSENAQIMAKFSLQLP